jgi:hypothetical protein
MRFFELLSFQHIMLYVFPTLLFILVFGVGLAFSHFKTGDSEKRFSEISHLFADGLRERNAPYPLVMMLIIAGTVAWVFFYILMTGFLGVKI